MVHTNDKSSLRTGLLTALALSSAIVHVVAAPDRVAPTSARLSNKTGISPPLKTRAVEVAGGACALGSSPTIQVFPDHGYAGQSVAVSGVGVSGTAAVRISWLTGPATATAAIAALAPTGSYSTFISVPADLIRQPYAQEADFETFASSYSNAGIREEIADSFRLAKSTPLTGLRWWGGFEVADAPLPTDNNFTIRVHADANGAPGGLLVQWPLGASVTHRDAGYGVPYLQMASREVAYRASLSPAFNAVADTTYWLVISNDTTGTPIRWGWESSHQGDGRAAFGTGGTSWTIVPFDAAFELLTEYMPVQVCAAAGGTAQTDFACTEFLLETPPSGSVRGTVPLGTTAVAASNPIMNLYAASGRREASQEVENNGAYQFDEVPPGAYQGAAGGTVSGFVAGGSVDVAPGLEAVLDLGLADIACNYGAWFDPILGAIDGTPNHQRDAGVRANYLGTYVHIPGPRDANQEVLVTFSATGFQTRPGVTLTGVEFQIETSQGLTLGLGTDLSAPYQKSYSVSNLPPGADCDDNEADPSTKNYLVVIPHTDELGAGEFPPACSYVYMCINVKESPLDIRWLNHLGHDDDHYIIRDPEIRWDGAARPEPRYVLEGKIAKLPPEVPLSLPAQWPDPPLDVPYIGDITNRFDAYVEFVGNLELDGDFRLTRLKAFAEATVLHEELFHEEEGPTDLIPPDVLEDIPPFNIWDVRNTRWPFGPWTPFSFDEDWEVYSGVLATFWGIVSVNASLTFGVAGEVELEGALKPFVPALQATLTPSVAPSVVVSVWVSILLDVVSAGADGTGLGYLGLPLLVDTERDDEPVRFGNLCLGFKVLLDVWARVNVWFWHHRWDLGSWELLCEDEPADCFCGGAVAGSQQSVLPPPDVMASPSVASGPSGAMLAVYTENTSPGAEYPTVKVMARFWDPANNVWIAATTISDGTQFVQDPVAAFVGASGHVLVAYTENTMTLLEQESVGNDLAKNLMRQEIVVAYWDGIAWTRTQLTDDLLADGRAAIAGDANGATLAWTRDAGDGDITTRNDLRIAVRNFTHSTATWDAMQTLTVLSRNSQVSVARRSGYAVIAWSSDADADADTNGDRFIAIAEGIAGASLFVSLPSQLPPGADTPSVAINPVDSTVELAMAVRGKDADGISDTGPITNRAALVTALRGGNGVWIATPITDGGSPVWAEQPRLAFSDGGITLLLFRRFGDAGTNAELGQIALMQKAPGAPTFSNPMYMTDTTHQHWQAAMAVNSAGQVAVVDVLRPAVLADGSPAVLVTAAPIAPTYSIGSFTGGNDAVQALVFDRGADPALQPTLDVSAAHASPGSIVDVTAHVWNVGRLAAGGLSVRFYSGPPSGGTLLGTIPISAALSFNQFTTAVLPVTRQPGPQLITAIVVAGTGGGDLSAANNSATVDLGAIPRPSNLSVAPSHSYTDALRVAWIAPPVPGVESYRILRSETLSGPFELVGESRAPFYHDRLLQAETPYHYVVEAVADDCVSSQSSAQAAGVLCGDLALDICDPNNLGVLREGVNIHDNRCASTDGPSDDGCYASPSPESNHDQVWYRFTATRDGVLTVSMCPDNGGQADYDAYFVVYDNGGSLCSCPSSPGNEIACANNNCGIFGGPTADIPVVEGNCYTIAVGGRDDGTGQGNSRGTGLIFLRVQPQPEPPIPVPDPAGPKTRAISFSVSPATTAVATGTFPQTAIRVTMLDLQNPSPANALCCPPPNFGAFESVTCSAIGESAGCARWVGPPTTFQESQDDIGLGVFRAARLQCSPYYHDWSAEGLVQVAGAEILPSSAYRVEVLAAFCKGSESTCPGVSTPVTMMTRRSGDVVSLFNPPSPTDQPDGNDVIALVNKFKNLAGAPSKAIGQIFGNFIELNSDVSGLDISAVVDAFKGLAYPYSGPCVCPSAVTCNATPCTSSAPCSGGVCVKTCISGTNSAQPCITDAHCPGGTCGTGFCRDRCGRCKP